MRHIRRCTFTNATNTMNAHHLNTCKIHGANVTQPFNLWPVLATVIKVMPTFRSVTMHYKMKQLTPPLVTKLSQKLLKIWEKRQLYQAVLHVDMIGNHIRRT